MCAWYAKLSAPKCINWHLPVADLHPIWKPSQIVTNMIGTYTSAYESTQNTGITELSLIVLNSEWQTFNSCTCFAWLPAGENIPSIVFQGIRLSATINQTHNCMTIDFK